MMVSPLDGLIAALPVVAVLGGGLAGGDPVAGVTMGAGAMLVGIAWRIMGGRPPLALLATDALLMAASTFVGCVTGSHPWLHLAVLGVWALMSGLLVSIGNRGGVLGTQALIAAVIFGRFSQPAPAALGLAGLVMAGGGAQVVFLAALRWPSSLRVQRAATAAVYRTLAALAADGGEMSSLPVGAALDIAGATLASPALFGDSALETLRSLVDEGGRMRIVLIAIRSLRSQSQARGADPEQTAADEVTAHGAEVLLLAAATIEGDRAAAAALGGACAQLSTLAAGFREAGGSGQLARRLAAWAGQLRAVASLAAAAGAGGGLRSRRPRRRTGRPLGRLSSDLLALRANASLRSPAGRHAVRLAVVVIGAELLARHLPLHRGYWMVVAAATALRPEFGATFTRGTERAVGTTLGVALAGAITVTLHPAGATTVVLVGALAWAAYSVFPASFAAGFGFITALVVFLINVISPDSLAIAEARLIDTLVGGSLGLLVFALWPTWAHQPAKRSLADLVAAARVYFDAVLAPLVLGVRARDDRLRPLARSARLARTQAEATVALSLSEPQTRRIDADESRGSLNALRRLIGAIHVIRLDAQDEGARSALPGLDPLVADVDEMLTTVEQALRQGGRTAGDLELPDLRAAYEAFEQAAPADDDGAALLAELDEVVDAANSLAASVGLEPAGAPTQPAPA